MSGIEPRPPVWQASALSIAPCPLGRLMFIVNGLKMRIQADGKKDYNAFSDKALSEKSPGSSKKFYRVCKLYFLLLMAAQKI